MTVNFPYDIEMNSFLARENSTCEGDLDVQGSLNTGSFSLDKVQYSTPANRIAVLNSTLSSINDTDPHTFTGWSAGGPGTDAVVTIAGDTNSFSVADTGVHLVTLHFQVTSNGDASLSTYQIELQKDASPVFTDHVVVGNQSQPLSSVVTYQAHLLSSESLTVLVTKGTADLIQPSTDMSMTAIITLLG